MLETAIEREGKKVTERRERERERERERKKKRERKRERKHKRDKDTETQRHLRKVELRAGIESRCALQCSKC